MYARRKHRQAGAFVGLGLHDDNKLKGCKNVRIDVQSHGSNNTFTVCSIVTAAITPRQNLPTRPERMAGVNIATYNFPETHRPC